MYNWVRPCYLCIKASPPIPPAADFIVFSPNTFFYSLWKTYLGDKRFRFKY